MIIHFVDEASKYHVAKIIIQARCPRYSDLGNCDAKELIAAISEWSRYMSHPSCFHVDEEGCFHSDEFKEYCGVKSIEIKMAGRRSTLAKRDCRATHRNLPRIAQQADGRGHLRRCDSSVYRRPRLRSKEPQWLLQRHLAEPMIPRTFSTWTDRHCRGFSLTF